MPQTAVPYKGLCHASGEKVIPTQDNYIKALLIFQRVYIFKAVFCHNIALPISFKS